MDTLQEVLGRLHKRGYNSVHSFFAAHPGEPYGKLLALIAEPVDGKSHYDLPIFTLKQAHQLEAVQTGGTRAYAKDTLVPVL